MGLVQGALSLEDLNWEGEGVAEGRICGHRELG